MTEKDDVVIVSGIRTPFSKFGSVLRDMHSSELGAIAIKECLKRVGMKGDDIDELYYGMCIQSEAALLYNVIARQALLKAGLPDDLIRPCSARCLKIPTQVTVFGVWKSL